MGERARKGISKTEEEVIQKVLIATDGSAHAAKAVEFGSDIAAKYGAEVVLVHVLLRDELSENLRHLAEVEYHAGAGGKPLAEAIAMIPEGRFPAASIQPRSAQTPGAVLRAVADEILTQAEREAKQHGVTRISRQIEDGNPVKRILEVAKDSKADLIVTGARGLSDLKALVVGSVSHKLSHLAPVTCITVR